VKASFEFLNMGQVLRGIKEKQEKLKALEPTAKKMGVLATNEIHPLTRKKSGNWDESIHAEVHPMGNFKVELWVGSKGAFSEGGYNYGARQERLYHPIEIGWHKARPGMIDLWQKIIGNEGFKFD